MDEGECSPAGTELCDASGRKVVLHDWLLTLQV